MKTILFVLFAHFCFAVNIDIPIGTSVATANTMIAGASPGDVVRFERGGTWVGQLNITVNGSSGSPITITAYGSGADPIITTRTPLPGWDTGGNWTNLGSNVWSKALAVNSQSTNHRIWLNGTEYSRAKTSASVNSTKRVSYNVDYVATLFVYATSNPATFYTLIEYNGIIESTVRLNDVDYITLQDLDIRGATGGTVEVEFSNHIIIENSSIGWDAGRIGIRKIGTCNDIIIRDNVIDSGDRLPDDFVTFWGIEDGISASGAGITNWYIYRNTIKDWGHSCVNIDINTGTGTNIEIYENFLSAENVDYCRGIGFDGVVGSNPTSSFKIYRNLIYKTKVQVQINCPNLQFYSNILNGMVNSPNPEAVLGTGKGIDILGYSGRSPTNMKIYNNVIANCASEGLRIARSSGYQMATGNEIINNIFYNNGEDTPSGYEDAQITIVENSADISGNTFRNNILYKTGVTDRIYYDNRNASNVFMTIAEMNAQNGVESDVISGNLSVDPLFVDGNTDFALQPGSQAKNAGIDLGSPYNIGLIPSTWPDDVNTGSQVGAWNLGAYVEAVVQATILVHSGKILTHAGKILIR